MHHFDAAYIAYTVVHFYFAMYFTNFLGLDWSSMETELSILLLQHQARISLAIMHYGWRVD